MRKALLAYLRCLKCQGTGWDLKVEKETQQEIRDAKLTCGSCKAQYDVHNGICDLIGDDLPPEVAREKEHAESHGYIKTEDGKEHRISR